MTTERNPLAAVFHLVRVVRELNDAAIAARPYVLAEAALENAGRGSVVGNPAQRHLLALDAAIADAGELLAEVSS